MYIWNRYGCVNQHFSPSPRNHPKATKKEQKNKLFLVKLEDRYYPKLPNMYKNSPKKLRLGRKWIEGNEEKKLRETFFFDNVSRQNILSKSKGYIQRCKNYIACFQKTCAMTEVKWAKGKYFPGTDLGEKREGVRII